MQRNHHLRLLRAIISFLVIAGTLFLTIDQLIRTKPIPDNTPATVFSAIRSFKHIRVLAQSPRLPGTKSYEEARRYIVDELVSLGLQPEDQETFSHGAGSNAQWYSSVDNIVARIDGSDSRDAILLTAHYDSGFFTPGANDDASGVAILLEVARALQTDLPMHNAVIFLFTGQEEVFCNGAEAFIEQHRWADDVKLVIGIDNGGVGPTILAETSPQNGRLIHEYTRTPPAVLASSAFLERGHVGDFGNAFGPHGFPGFAFDYPSAPRRVHSRLDSIESVDLAAIQQEGDQVLALARRFGNLELRDTQEPTPVFFTLLRLGIVSYSPSFAIVWMCLASIAFLGIMILGLRMQYLTPSGMVLAVSAPLLSGSAGIGFAYLLWMLVIGRLPFYQYLFQGQPYNLGLLMSAFASVVIAAITGTYAFLQHVRKVSLQDLTMGALALTGVATIGTSLLMPGISYLFTWPLLLGLPAVGYGLYSRRAAGAAVGIVPYLLSLLPTLAGSVLLIPALVLGALGLPISDMYFSLLMLVALLLCLVPHLELICGDRLWALPIMSGLAALGLLTVVLFARYDAKQPEPVTVFYFKDGDTGNAYWGAGSPDYPLLDSWSAQFFPADPEKSTLAEDHNPLFNPTYFTGAPNADLQLPTVELVEETVRSNVRTLHLHFPSGGASELHVWPMSREFRVLSLQVNGMPSEVNFPNDWWFSYSFMPPEGIDVVIEIEGPMVPVRLLLAYISYGLPEIPELSIKPMPDNMFVSVYAARFAYQTVIARQVTLGEQK